MGNERIQYEIGAEDVLNSGEYDLLRRAQRGEVSCPWCELPLVGTFYFSVERGIQTKGVRLFCSGCGFDER